VVVAGGYNGKKNLSTTELYQPSLNKWSSIASLNGERDDHALVASGKKLFAFGGVDDNDNELSSMEQLSSSVDRK